MKKQSSGAAMGWQYPLLMHLQYLVFVASFRIIGFDSPGYVVNHQTSQLNSDLIIVTVSILHLDGFAKM